MSILITGGAGYIGSHTVVKLLEAGYRVVVVDNYVNSSPKALERVKIITGKDFPFYERDIRDKDKLDEIFKSHKIDAVIHFAGLKSVGESCEKPLEYYDNNIYGTLTLLDVMRKNGCKNIVFSSSATVYGGENTPPFTEDMKTGSTTSPYGSTKLYIEGILKDMYRSDNSWHIVLLRYFNPVGAHESGLIGENPNGTPNNLMPYITKVALGKIPNLHVFGGNYPTKDGTCIRDYIHVTDLAEGHVKAYEKVMNSAGVNIYNLGTGAGTSVLDVINAFKRVNNVDVPYEITSRREGDVAVCYANADKALKELHWKAVKTLDDMCRDAYNWQRKNPDGY